jgi:hypothetical protein
MQKTENNNSNKVFTIPPEKSGLSNLISKIKNHFFTPPPPEVDPEIKLKASKIDGDASKILSHLFDIKKRLENELDNETYGYLVRILNPLADDVKKMSGLLEKANQTEELSSILESYQQWSTKAKRWIHLTKESNRSEHIVQGIVEHLLGELSASIDRDIRSITNYREQVYNSLSAEASDSLDPDLYAKLTEATAPHIGALNALKERKIHPELELFAEWKRWVNARRAVLFENALLVLDEYK